MTKVRNIACVAAAAFVGLGLTAAATQALAQSPQAPVVVEGKRIDPELQRKVSYADLNLAIPQDERRLKGRIWRTASGLCFALNGLYESGRCTRFAVASTDDQVEAAVDRAKRKMAGLPVGPAIAIAMVIAN